MLCVFLDVLLFFFLSTCIVIKHHLFEKNVQSLFALFLGVRLINKFCQIPIISHLHLEVSDAGLPNEMRMLLFVKNACGVVVVEEESDKITPVGFLAVGWRYIMLFLLDGAGLHSVSLGLDLS